ncbi:hypothetical protein [Synechococcus phage S-RS29]|nr:hypothetical protein [Synechococcus phage S-RS29]
MTSYQKAVKALEECVKDAMENDIDASTQSEIWRHYQGMKAINKKVGRSSFAVSEGVIDFYNPDYNIQAAQPVDNISISTGGKDVITFS